MTFRNFSPVPKILDLILDLENGVIARTNAIKVVT